MKNKSNIFPNSWIEKTIEDVCTSPQYGYTTKAVENGDIKLLRTTDITSGKINWKTVPYCLKNPENPKKYFLKEGDIVISRAGSVGISYLITKPEKAVFASYLIRFNPLINKKLFKYFLESPFYWTNISEKKLGIAVQNVNATKLKSIKLPVPPLSEQLRIVDKIEELFSELDNGVESLKKAREQLKTYRQAVLKYAFEGKLTQEWREQQIQAGNPLEPAEKLLERIKKEREAHYQKQVEEWKKACEQAKKDGSKKTAKPRKPKDLSPLTENELAELPELPDAWGWSYLDYCGYWTGGGTPSKQRKDYWLDGDVLWVSPKDMKNQYIKITIDKITKAAVEESSAKLIPSDSVLFVVRSGILRRTLPVSITTEISTVNQDLQAFTPFKVFPEYVYWYCVANEFNIRNNCAKSGTTVESIETTQLKKYRISLCSPEEQQAIVSEIEIRLSVCDQLEQTIEDSLTKAEALRQSILKKAFEGELTREWRAAHPELISGENSAESLLARIREEKESLRKNSPQRLKRRKGKSNK